jgi:ABC-type spermidine/putrescine transport system permease subunit II
MTTNDPYAPPASTVRDVATGADEPSFRWGRVAVFAVLTNLALVAAAEAAAWLVQRSNDEAFASVESIVQAFEQTSRWANVAMQVAVFVAFFACLAPVRRRRMLHALALWLATHALFLPVIVTVVSPVATNAWLTSPGWQAWAPALAIAATYAFDRIVRR